ncbi:MAG: hypothetical protein CMN32_00970 [Saprospirales bacterium]|nr:hypothetical protein [Saprospirales bacterium]
MRGIMEGYGPDIYRGWRVMEGYGPDIHRGWRVMEDYGGLWRIMEDYGGLYGFSRNTLLTLFSTPVTLWLIQDNKPKA